VERRHITSAITLLVLVALLVVGVMVGVKALFAPLPKDPDAAGTPSPTCSEKVVKKGQRLRSTQVVVSVYNGGTRAGLADTTMQALANRGFKQGEVGNAPAATRVNNVRVYASARNDQAANLVARQFGRATKITVSDIDLGPGVDVVVGNGFDKLAKARRVIVAQKASSVCVPLPSETADLL
jgi:hypothetical protein